MNNSLENHPVVSETEWLAARKELLRKEKEHTRLGDQLSEARRELPWVKVEKEYRFEGPAGTEMLAELFNGRSQLVIYHFMFAPGWQEGCQGCSFLADHIDGANLHLAHHDVSLVVVSRASWLEFEAFKKRMGWKFKWMSSYDSDFNTDYHVAGTPNEIAAGRMFYNYAMMESAGGEQPGLSVFYKDENGDIFHTYSSYGRGGDILIGAYNYLDLTPKGRNETEIMDWLRLHDKYEDAAPVSESCCQSN